MHRDSNASVKNRDLFVGKMKNREAFQTQLASILETLAKAAVTEITKLVEDRSVVLRLEVSKSHKEIDCLRRKLQLTESRLRTTQEAATRESHSVGVQFENLIEAATRENCFIGDQAEDPFEEGGAVKCGTDAPFAEQINQKNCKAQTRDTRPDFGFALKEEQEGERVARLLHRTESEHSAGRLNNNCAHRASQFFHPYSILLPPGRCLEVHCPLWRKTIMLFMEVL
ncbi:hypothetical protein GJAV_G00093690 [Gymnothorax javanicus]|nr:hypothetical protein GJAV_G00093690 [Gymnothorax javanicus]